MRRKGNKRKTNLRARGRSVMVRATDALKRALPVVAMVVTALAIPVGSYLGYQQLVGSSHFAVSSVSVTGLEHVSEIEFLEKIGFVPGMNYFDLNANRVDVLGGELSWVETITVEKKLPDHVAIAVTEKVPAGVHRHDGTFTFFDAEGVSIAPVVTKTDWERAAELTWVAGADVEPSDRVEAVRLGAAIAKHEIGPLSELKFERHLGFVALIEPGFEVRLGKDKFDERLSRVEEILKHEPRENLKYILVDQAAVGRRITVGHKLTTVAKLGQGKVK